jgi:hypothetical protein
MAVLGAVLYWVSAAVKMDALILNPWALSARGLWTIATS